MIDIAASTPIYSQFKADLFSIPRYIYNLDYIYFSCSKNWICIRIVISGAGLLTIQLNIRFERMEGSIII